MYAVEFDEEEFKLFSSKEDAENFRCEVASCRSEGCGKEWWVAAYEETYMEIVEKCSHCGVGYVMPNLICNHCKKEFV